VLLCQKRTATNRTPSLTPAAARGADQLDPCSSGRASLIVLMPGGSAGFAWSRRGHRARLVTGRTRSRPCTFGYSHVWHGRRWRLSAMLALASPVQAMFPVFGPVVARPSVDSKLRATNSYPSRSIEANCALWRVAVAHRNTFIHRRER